MSECKKCNGRLSYTVFDHHTDAPLSVECWDCLSVLNMIDNIAEDFSRLLRNASPEKLAQLLASHVVNAVYRENERDLNRLEDMVKSKDLVNALALCSAYVG